MPAHPAQKPFDDFRDLVRRMPPADENAIAGVREREAQLTKPAGSLGRLEEIAEWLAGWQNTAKPKLDNALVAIFAASHGITARGVSAFPAEVNRQMVANFTHGGAAINQLCTTFDLGLKVFELALDMPSPDITLDDAFDETGCAATIAYGMEAVHGDLDLLVIGEMGIGNTTVAACINHALFGGTADQWVGRGTGVDDAGLKRKADAVAAAVGRLGASPRDPFEVLRRVGGRDIAAMVGAIIAARFARTPVVLDGYVVSAAAAVLHALDPAAIDHCIAGHVSAEAPHRRLLDILGKKPLLDLGLRLGEGSGAALATGLIRAAVATHGGMATFAEAAVAGKSP